jgi:hypothetical protein
MDEPLRRARVRVPVRRRAEVLARRRDGAGVAREEGARRGGRGGVERVGRREDSVRRRRGGGGEGRGRRRAWVEERGVRRGRGAEDEGRVSWLLRRRFQSGHASPLRSVCAQFALRGGVRDNVVVDQHVLRALVVIGERRARLNGAGASSGDGGATSTFPVGRGDVWEKS